MGFSDPPGHFFLVAVGALLIGTLVFFLAPPPWRYAGVLLLIVCLISLCCSVVAVWDQKPYGISKCPKCGHEPRVWPWSM